jgi:hypothetical protein
MHYSNRSEIIDLPELHWVKKMPRKKIYLTKADLISRGWTESLILRFLGSPDSIRPADGWGTAAANTWEGKRVKTVEASSKFLTALEKSFARRKLDSRTIEIYEKNRKRGPVDLETRWSEAIQLLVEDFKEQNQLSLEEELDRELRRSITDWKIQQYQLPSFAQVVIHNRIAQSKQPQECRIATEKEAELYSLHEMLLNRDGLLFAKWNGAYVMSDDCNEAKTSILPQNIFRWVVQFPKYPNVVFAQGRRAFPSRLTLAGRFDRQFLTRAEYEVRETQALSKKECESLMSRPEFVRLSNIWSRAWYPDELKSSSNGIYWKFVHGTLLLCALNVENDIHQLFFDKVKHSVNYQAKKKKIPFYQELWNKLFAV